MHEIKKNLVVGGGGPRSATENETTVIKSIEFFHFGYFTPTGLISFAVHFNILEKRVLCRPNIRNSFILESSLHQKVTVKLISVIGLISVELQIQENSNVLTLLTIFMAKYFSSVIAVADQAAGWGGGGLGTFCDHFVITYL